MPDENNDINGFESSRYVEDRVMQVGYYNSNDIYSFLRRGDDIKEFVSMLVEENIKDSKYIDAHGNRLFKPFFWIGAVATFGIDYQYFIYILAKFVSKKMGGDKDIFKRVLNDYALLSKNLKSPVYVTNRRLLMMFFEQKCWLFNNGNYSRQCKYYELYTPRLIEFNDKIIFHKTLAFNWNGINKFVNFDEIMAENETCFERNEPNTLAWGKMNVAKYAKENKLVKFNYFTLDFDDLGDMNTLFERSYAKI